ncbi:DUF2922 domain-containing protein [Piscibacillus halophilus]|uniref:DUF2922 domain-containing protein n=1 Tax=Piscibacillus halophilus TaxID=571933 RepID=A0A1H9GWL1_9BACI|nr:DUF2922 domain-containing protein [Piscibacillus halophilus]SEQ54512.1 Protein of unknown function [Piscibacillus halophilus]
MAKRLELKFRNELGTIATISLDNPVDPADPVAIKQAMDTIIANNVFVSNGGALVEIDRAQIVDRTVTEIPLSE